uniref:Vitronectin b n=1 Tax=Tetraodon nigroviridis TaxID=99883 RepID=H3BYW3_TETNG
AVLLSFVLLLDAIFAAEESCRGRCGSFNTRSKCQCDHMCLYYGSCCRDFDAVCPKKSQCTSRNMSHLYISHHKREIRSFFPMQHNCLPQFPVATPSQRWKKKRRRRLLRPRQLLHRLSAHLQQRPPPLLHPPPRSHPVEADAGPCSGRPFDAFLQLKNTSIYAFRGEYFFELDEESILPGYPKLIEDVWGIPGPIDAAFTRINCHGKSYIFKGDQYWRFDADAMDEGYPRNISVGFVGVPDGVDAAFAVPAPSHRGKEKAYFFKDNKYYQYEFKHQPSHEECVEITAAPSLLFSRYTDLFCDQTMEDLFIELFGGPVTTQTLVSSRETGVASRGPVDATMVGRVMLAPTPTSPPPRRKWSNRKRKAGRNRKQRRRQSRFVYFYDLWSYDDLFDDDFHTDVAHSSTSSTPVQNVYFFKTTDKYYRVNLQTKRVDSAVPPYPRSIAKYWLGCEETVESVITPGAEKS